MLLKKLSETLKSHPGMLPRCWHEHSSACGTQDIQR